MNLEDDLRRLFADDSGLDLPAAGDAERAVVTGARRVRRCRRVAAGAGGALAAVVLVGAGVALAGVGGTSSMPPAEPMPTIVRTTTGLPPSTVVAPGGGTDHTVASGQITVPRTHTAPPKPPDRTTQPTTQSPQPPADPVPIGPSGYNGLTLGMTAEQAESTGLLVPNAAPVLASGCKGYNYVGLPRPAYEYSVVISDKYGLVRMAGLADSETPEGIYLGSSEQSLHDAYPTPAGSGIPDEWVTEVSGNPDAYYSFFTSNGRVSQIRLELKNQDCY